MAADLPREIKDRRPAVWPWLVLPVIILLVFWALRSVHQRPADAAADQPQPAAAPAPTATAGGETSRQ